MRSDHESKNHPDPGADRGWYHRGYVPHYDSTKVIQSITFRLADSLPAKRLAQLEHELEAIPPERHDPVRRRWIERYLDTGAGCCVLARPEAAWLLYDTFNKFDGIKFTLHAWVIMPNHTHVLLQPLPGHALGSIVQSVKSWTGKRLLPMMPAANLQDSDRRAWQADYWDRYIRNAEHYAHAVRYIEHNPVQAGLVQRPEDWRWSSAYQISQS